MKSPAVSVVVPWRPSTRARTAAWEWVAAHYRSEHPEWEVVTGDGTGDEWSKGAAVDDAVSRASGDLLVIADADSFVAPHVLAHAVETAQTAAWVVAHSTVRRLTQEASERLYGAPDAAPDVEWPVTVGPRDAWPGGGLTVLRRTAYETVGGIDPRFTVWGNEDTAFGLSLDRLVGYHTIVPGVLWHLWHPPFSHTRLSRENQRLHHRYVQAKHSVEQLRALAGEHRVARRGSTLPSTDDRAATSAACDLQ